MRQKKNIFITGATGVMGMATLKELSHRLDRFSLTLLARHSKKNIKKLKPFLSMEGIDVIWGDLLNPEDVAKGVKDADFVLHMGGMVSPAADYYPEKTIRVNTLSMQYIVDAVKSRPDSDKVGVVYVGSVAQYGEHMPPDVWGCVGDRLSPAADDAYAVSKIAAERILSDSGLKKWVSLRQTSILSPALLQKAMDPITFHVPLKGVLEWVTAEDSGRLMANVCEERVPENFWLHFYNVGGGETYRVTNYEFEKMFLKAMKCPPPEKVFDSRWFATRNFHGMWFGDSDILDSILHFRSGKTMEEYFIRMGKDLPWFYSLTPLVPPIIIKGVMGWVAGRNRLAPFYWKKYNDTERIERHFGSLEDWENLPDWDNLELTHPCIPFSPVSHGYDEEKPYEKIGIDDMRSIARHNGGECVSEYMQPGDLSTPLEWKTGEGVSFPASPLSVMGGHWGPPLTLKN